MRFVISAILLAQLFPASERDEYEDTLGFWLLCLILTLFFFDSMWLQYNEEVDYYADNTATWTDTEQRLPGGNPVYGW